MAHPHGCDCICTPLSHESPWIRRHVVHILSVGHGLQLVVPQCARSPSNHVQFLVRWKTSDRGSHSHTFRIALVAFDSASVSTLFRRRSALEMTWFTPVRTAVSIGVVVLVHAASRTAECRCGTLRLRRMPSAKARRSKHTERS